MSILPNAPLIEVIFEIKWQITNKNDLVEFQYLHGDLYAVLKNHYPVRENLLPPDFPMEALNGVPMYRFRKEKNGYPLYQLGPGILSINVTDEKYFWSNFQNDINLILDAFVNTFPNPDRFEFVPLLSYIDFFPIDVASEKPIEFINKNLNLKVEQSFIDSEENNEINLSLSYKLEQDLLSLIIKKGTYNQKEGLVLHTKMIGPRINYSRESLSKWIDNSHENLRNIFKRTVTEEFYKTFK
jgi:uncharacterized protein (TIGR04255 family)